MSEYKPTIHISWAIDPSNGIYRDEATLGWAVAPVNGPMAISMSHTATHGQTLFAPAANITNYTVPPTPNETTPVSATEISGSNNNTRQGGSIVPTFASAPSSGAQYSPEELDAFEEELRYYIQVRIPYLTRILVAAGRLPNSRKH